MALTGHLQVAHKTGPRQRPHCRFERLTTLKPSALPGDTYLLGPDADWEAAQDHALAVFEVAGEPLPGFVAEALRRRP